MRRGGASRRGRARLGIAALAALAGCGAPGSSASTGRLYAEHCASCHGADGRGSPARRGLERGIDLVRSDLVVNRERAVVFQRIAFGFGTMPGFSHRLSQGELEDLADYVLRLAPETGDAPGR